jgi:glycosyltransferase involved in cell wall biosynthesis
MSDVKLDVFIFSFNRGAWLENLLSSVHDCLKNIPDVKLYIFDDDSDEEITLKVLQDAKKAGISILRALDFESSSFGSRGGLHAGIKASLCEVSREDSLALLLQDDMQIVRDLKCKDLELAKMQIKNSGNPFLYVNFWTGGVAMRSQQMVFSNKGFFHKFSPREKRFRAYTDVCLVDVNLLRSSKFDFQNSEKQMDQNASRVFGKMAWSPYPFTAMLPDPSVYRNGVLFQGNIFRFEKMTSQNVDNFLSRNVVENLPVSENFLKIENHDLPSPWLYGVELSWSKKILLKITKTFFALKLKVLR